MRKVQNVLIVVGMVVGVVLVGIALGWWGSKPGGSNPPPGDTSSPAAGAGSSRSQPGTSGLALAPKTASNPSIGPTSRTNQGSTELSSPTTSANLITNWEDKLDEILTAEGEDSDKAKKMLAMFPRLPAEGQVEVAQHLSNLVPDENYAALARYLADPKLPEDVLDVLMADVLNRPNSLKLPALLEVARDAQHPKAGEAKDLLELFLEEDYGSDWNLWQVKMEEWLKANPD
jgi:hypothetical protein